MEAVDIKDEHQVLHGAPTVPFQVAGRTGPVSLADRMQRLVAQMRYCSYVIGLQDLRSVARWKDPDKDASGSFIVTSPLVMDAHRTPGAHVFAELIGSGRPSQAQGRPWRAWPGVRRVSSTGESLLW